MIDSIGVERRRATFDAVYGVSLRQEKLGEISAVLSGNSGDQSGPRQSILHKIYITSEPYSYQAWRPLGKARL
jgi:hypothetical protein